MNQPFEAISAETLEAIQKAQTNGVNISTGVFGYDLSGIVSLVPVVTPLYDRIPRKQGPVGSNAANWRALLNVNNQQPNPFSGRDGGGGLVVVSEQDVSQKYQPVRVSGKVTRDAVDFARNYADAKGIASVQTLMQWRIADKKTLFGGQAYPLPNIGTVTLTTATTGGSIHAATTFYVKAAARSALNYYWGGSSIASASATITTGAGATNSVTAVVPAVKGAVAYDWFTSVNNVAYFYAGTTTVNKNVFTSVLAAAATLPNIPDLYATPPANIPPAVDTSYSVDAYNVLLACTLGDYTPNAFITTPGTAISSGATYISLDGASFTATSQGITELDDLNSAIYAQAQVSPTAYLVAPQQASDMASHILGTNQAVTYLQPEQGRVGITGGASLARYINRVTGDTIEIVPDPHQPPGTVVAVTERVPYPNSGIANTFEVRTLREVAQFDYGVPLSVGASGGPAEVWDQSAIEALVHNAPVSCGVISNIAKG